MRGERGAFSRSRQARRSLVAMTPSGLEPVNNKYKASNHFPLLSKLQRPGYGFQSKNGDLNRKRQRQTHH
jgi:hypothetical protein